MIIDLTGRGGRAQPYGARLYNAKIGRMLSAETVVPESGNRYSYVLNNPTTTRIR